MSKAKLYTRYTVYEVTRSSLDGKVVISRRLNIPASAAVIAARAGKLSGTKFRYDSRIGSIVIYTNAAPRSPYASRKYLVLHIYN